MRIVQVTLFKLWDSAHRLTNFILYLLYSDTNIIEHNWNCCSKANDREIDVTIVLYTGTNHFNNIVHTALSRLDSQDTIIKTNRQSLNDSIKSHATPIGISV